jgi:hypothetical protein
MSRKDDDLGVTDFVILTKSDLSDQTCSVKTFKIYFRLNGQNGKEKPIVACST